MRESAISVKDTIPPAENTLPKLLMHNYQRWGDTRIAMRRKIYGIWEEYTWKDVYEKVKYFALALVSFGFQPSDKIAFIGDNDPEMFWAELAAQAAGGAVTGVFADCLPDEVKFQVSHSDSKFVVAQDQEQVDKILQIEEELPLLIKIVYWDPKGITYDNPHLITFDKFLKQGMEYEKTHPGLFEEMVARGKGEDLALLCYTSGTTGVPKGASINHNTLILWIKEMIDADPVYETDRSVSFSLPGWIVEQMFGHGYMLYCGESMNFPEEQETVQGDLREIAPTTLLYASRLWEAVNSEIHVRITDSSPVKKIFFNLFMPVGYRVADMDYQKKKPNLFWKTLHGMGHLLVFRPLLDKHGLLKIRIAYTAGAILGPDIFRFFRAMGLNIKQMYGMTEAGIISIHRQGDAQFESVGTPLGYTTVRVAQDGEILIKMDKALDGYYKNEQAYQEKTAGGWFHTGDAGYINDDGHIIYIDRVADLKTLSNGAKFSPQYIESRIKFSPYILDAIVLGEQIGDFVGAIVNLDFRNVGKWAEDRNIPYTTFTDLSQKPQIRELIGKEITRLNRHLPENSRIKKFINLHKQFDADEADLTRTRKIRREFMEKRYGNLVAAIYSGKEELVEETPVTYQDGRKGTITTNIKVNVVGDFVKK